MSARDDYPLLASWATLAPGAPTLGHPTRTMTQSQGALDEIDRLRGANEFMREVLDDVLPTFHVQGTTYFKVDGHWARITIEPATPAEPLQAKATIVT